MGSKKINTQLAIEKYSLFRNAPPTRTIRFKLWSENREEIMYIRVHYDPRGPTWYVINFAKMKNSLSNMTNDFDNTTVESQVFFRRWAK